ncbi:MAG: carboxylesterase family protein [Bacteroidetes bacterium]|nr:carboxylesterase family protein [Bacteroidota bacterium]
MRQSLLLVIFICLSLYINAQCTSRRYLDTVFHNVTVTSGIRFGSATTQLGLPQDLYLDFYEPSGDTLSQRPLIVYAFGGAFLIGTRNQPPIPTYCTYYAQCGYAVASIDYRIGFDVLSTGSAVRAVYRAAQDLRASVRFLCQRYPQYRIDTTAIFLTGSSAGCFSALHSCFMEPSDVPSYVQGIPLEPDDLGCYDCSTNADNNRRMPHIRGIMNHWGAILDTLFIRPTAKDNVPVISLHGDQDNLVPYTVGSPFGYPIFPVVDGSVPIHARMDHLGIKNELHPLYGYSHEPWLLAPQLLDTCYKYEIPFLYSILKPDTITIAGPAALCTGVAATYSVALRSGSHYCWTYTGATALGINGNTVTLSWATPGTYQVIAREMSRNEVNGDPDTFYVQVVAPPVAGFAAVVTHTGVQLTDSSHGAVSWWYSLGDGATAAQQSPSHTYAGAGSFAITQIVSNGLCADTAFRSIVTDTCPVVHLHYVLSHDTLYVTAEPPGLLSYQWTFGDGSADSGVSTYHLYTHSQNYLVALSAISDKGCTGSESAIVAYTQPSGVSDIADAGFGIFPNPAHGLVTVTCVECDLTIYDCVGRLLIDKYGVNNEILDISGLSAGVYSWSIAAAGRTGYGRLVVR